MALPDIGYNGSVTLVWATYTREDADYTLLHSVWEDESDADVMSDELSDIRGVVSVDTQTVKVGYFHV